VSARGAGAGIAELVLVRHGETAWNRDRRIQGHLDTALNDEGLRQARAAARRLAADARRDGAGPAPPALPALVSSDLLRCRQTAEPIAAALGVPLGIEPALRERHFGVYQGRTWPQILRDDAERAARWLARDPDLEVEGGESLRAFARRAGDALAMLGAAHLGRTLIVVTHGGVLDVAHRLARGLPLEAPRDFEIANASLNRLRFDGERFEMVCWGDVSHWRDALDEL
jgi:probable phosphoglycerate mutase